MVAQLVASEVADLMAALWVHVSVTLKAATKADIVVDYRDGYQVALKEPPWDCVLAGLSVD